MVPHATRWGDGWATGKLKLKLAAYGRLVYMSCRRRSSVDTTAPVLARQALKRKPPTSSARLWQNLLHPVRYDPTDGLKQRHLKRCYSLFLG